MMFKKNRCFVNFSLPAADKKILDNALAYLRREKTMLKGRGHPPGDENCIMEDSLESRADHQIKLRCRQLSSVVQEMRKAILRHDWKETATLLMILCHPGIKIYAPIITCFILIFCHKNSNFKFLQNFIRSVTGFILDEDINKFLKIAFILRRSAFKTVKNTKYNYYKVTKDPEFDKVE